MATITGDITRHPLLAELDGKVEEILHVFGILPSMYHMDGLDILQDLVNVIIKKITRGRVNSVKFVPVEANDKQQQLDQSQQTNSLQSGLVVIKTEPEDTMSAGHSDLDLAASSSNTTTCNAQLVQLEDGSYAYVTSSCDLNTTELNVSATLQDIQDNQDSTNKQAKPTTKSKRTSKTQKAAARRKSSGKNQTAEKPKKKAVKNIPKATSPGKTKAGNKRAQSKTRRERASCNQERAQSNELAEQSEENIQSGKKKVQSNKEKTARDANQLTPKPGSPSAETSVIPTETSILEEANEEEKQEIMLKLIPPEMRLKCGAPRKGGRARTKGRFQCSECDYKTDKKFLLNSHMIRHTKTRKFDCKKCGKFFTAASSLRRHHLIHDGIKPHICPICSKTFIDLGGLRSHSVVHTGERLYECDQCSKTYTNAGNLRRHKRLHSGEKPYSCEDCQVSYRDYSSLRLHLLKHTGEKPFQCEFCNKQFKTSSDSRRHERTHTGERKYICKDCGKTFVQGWHLKQHQRLHGNKFPWGPCDLCDKRFCTKAALQHHQRWHAGIKPHKCVHCHKSFSTKKYMQMHQVVHTSAKPYHCKTCGTAFNQISNLKRHERIHSTLKRYKCHFCPKAFKYLNSLQYHEGTHTGAMFTCEKCGLSRRSRNGIRKHTCSMSLVDKLAKKEEEDAEACTRNDKEETHVMHVISSSAKATEQTFNNVHNKCLVKNQKSAEDTQVLPHSAKLTGTQERGLCSDAAVLDPTNASTDAASQYTNQPQPQSATERKRPRKRKAAHPQKRGKSHRKDLSQTTDCVNHISNSLSTEPGTDILTVKSEKSEATESNNLISADSNNLDTKDLNEHGFEEARDCSVTENDGPVTTPNGEPPVVVADESHHVNRLQKGSTTSKKLSFRNGRPWEGVSVASFEGPDQCNGDLQSETQQQSSPNMPVITKVYTISQDTPDDI